MSAYVIVERGNQKGQRFVLESFPVTIGRGKASDIIIDDNEISRQHIRIKRRGRLFIIEDIGSKNGSHVNGDKVLNSIINNGDKILIGNTELHFVTAETGLQISDQIAKFDMLVAENMGLTGPLLLKNQNGSDRTIARRFPPHFLGGKIGNNMAAVQKVFDLHSNILVVHDFKEAVKVMLKSIGILSPTISRACVFQWNANSKQLFPVSQMQFKKEAKPFIISHRLFEEVISRQQGALVNSGMVNMTQPGPHRLVLPIIQNDQPLCLIHMEADDPRKPIPDHEIELIQALIHRCAPTLESLILRRDIDGWMVGMIDTLISIVEAKDTYTRGHSERVSNYCMAIADELKLNRELKRLLLVSGLCHDIGKVGIPDSILKKAASLSSEEYEEMKLHPTIGASIIESMPNANRFMSGIKYHHEKWDGTGYPDGLEGEDIPFFGRIVAIADTFDAMVSGRSYTGFMDQTDAVERLETEKELFDPEIFKAFVRAYENGTLTIKTDTLNNKIPEELDQQEAQPKEQKLKKVP